MIQKWFVVLAIILGSEIIPEVVFAQVDCSVLDPRASVSKEQEGKISGSLNTLYKIAKAGGSLEAKVKEEIQNLQKGVPVDEKNLIKLRAVYLFCGMFANDRDLTPERKVAIFNLMMGIREQDQSTIRSNTHKNGTNAYTKEEINVTPEERTIRNSDSASLIRSDFSAYEAQRLKLGSSRHFFTKNAPLHYRVWRKEAERGNAMAQVLVGRALRTGVGAPEDKIESAKWFERAADQRNAAGQYNLGVSYSDGAGVEKDQTTALAFFEQAASQNHPGAIRELGNFYRWGHASTRRDAQKANKLYQQAISLGDTGALLAAANLYSEGAPSFPLDRKKAVKLYAKAASIGNEIARGMLASNEIAAQLEVYASSTATTTARESCLKNIRLAIQTIDDINIEGLIIAFGIPKVAIAIETILNFDASDPMREVLGTVLNGLAKRFSVSDRTTRATYLREFSMIVAQNAQIIVDAGKPTDIEEVCRDIYKGLDISGYTTGEQDATVRLLAACIHSLHVAGYRTDAISLADKAVIMIDTILREHSWHWYMAGSAMQLFWDVGDLLSQVGDVKKSQEYLSRAWNLVFNRYGKTALIGRYAPLPTKGNLPTDVRDEDRVFFQEFAQGAKEKKDSEKSLLMSRFTIPTNFDGTTSPFYYYIVAGKEGYKGLQDQFVWVKEFRGGKVPGAAQESFSRLNKIAVENNVDFRDLCIYAMGKADKKTEEGSSE
jgi:tetratricopeptide (TPR) repeat protein